MYRFLPRLPRHGHYYASVLDHEESAAELLRGGPASTRFGMLGWTYERDLLTSILDSMAHLNATLIQVNSKDGQRPTVNPSPRPRTAIDRLEAREALEAHRQRVRMWAPRPEALN